MRVGSVRAKTKNTQSLKYPHLSALQVLHIIRSCPACHFRHHVIQDLEFTPREHAVQTLANANHHHQHQGEENGGLREGLDEPQDDQTRQLDQREEVDPLQWNLNRQSVTVDRDGISC